ncbi:hypothetical protein SVAN01_05950 [Stagonosporopsis vannaccii]|nr:hypothetical protein SVAN01_05950 [Stagonosporopsis vannaccii]
MSASEPYAFLTPFFICCAHGVSVPFSVGQMDCGCLQALIDVFDCWRQCALSSAQAQRQEYAPHPRRVLDYEIIRRFRCEVAPWSRRAVGCRPEKDARSGGWTGSVYILYRRVTSVSTPLARILHLVTANWTPSSFTLRASKFT